MKGRCYYCQKELTERTIKRHIKSCSEIKKVITEEINSDGEVKDQFIISIKDKYDKNTYCIYLLIDAGLQLQHLDQFIRDVWVECCGHLSAFFIDGIQYDDNRNELYEMNVKLKDVLSVGQKFEYEYDFGSTTYLILEVVDKIKTSRNHSQIEILARNNENHYKCIKCGKPAQYYNYYTGSYFCEDCAEKSREEGMEEFEGNYFNSPRDGVCGYVGDKDAELPYMPGNNEKYTISRKKPQLDYDDEFDFDGGISYDDENPILKELLAYVDSCTENEKNALKELLNGHADICRELDDAHNDLIDMFRKGVFSFKLEELLKGYTKAHLNIIAEKINIKMKSNDSKKTYIEKLILGYESAMKSQICMMDKDKYNIIETCIKNKGVIPYGEENICKYMFLAERGILFPAISEEQPVFVMPDVFQNIFTSMNTIEVINKIKNNSEIIKLFFGMIRAYGVLSYKDTIMLLKKYVNIPDPEYIISLLENNEEYYNLEYEVIEDEDNIFSDEDDDFRFFASYEIGDIDELLCEIDDEMQYADISREKLISMADSEYLEKSNLGKTFINELLDFSDMSKENAIDVMYVLSDEIQMQSLDETIKELIEGINVEFPKDAEFYLKQIVTKLLKNIPIWTLKGATIKQIEDKKADKKPSSEKIGRNDACPCGSGKKYKNCCGKVINLFK